MITPQVQVAVFWGRRQGNTWIQRREYTVLREHIHCACGKSVLFPIVVSHKFDSNQIWLLTGWQSLEFSVLFELLNYLRQWLQPVLFVHSARQVAHTYSME